MQIARYLVGLVVCLVANALPSEVPAQYGPWEPPLRAGSLVRVSHGDPCCRSPQVGALLSLGPDSIVLNAARGADTVRIALPRHAVRSLEHSWMTRSYGGRGTALGVLAGIGAGVVTLASIGRGCQDTDCLGWMLLSPYVIGGGVVIGGVIGWAIGRSVHTEVWRPVRLLPTRVAIAPGYDRGLTLRLTLSF